MKVLRCGVRAVGSREKTFMGKFQIGLISTVLVLIPAMAMAAATSCDKLASVALPNAKIDSAQSVLAGDFTLPAAAGGQWQVSTSGGIQPRWRRDGKEIYFVAPDGKLMAAPIAVKGGANDAGVPAALFQTRLWGGGANAINNAQYAVASDGRFLMNVTTEDAAGSPITLLLNWKPKP